MKISEILTDEDGIILKPQPKIRRRPRRPHQIGYQIRIGDRSIPTPAYQPDDAIGVINGEIGG